MSDITPTTQHCLENLPDEILLTIFQYVKPIDLLSFKGHNQRLNNVIHDIKLSIVLQHPEEDVDEKEFYYLTNFLPAQVMYLEVCYRWETLDLNAFQELRSLTLNCTYLSKNQLDQVSLLTSQYFS
jgi:hypothetical protein